MRAGSMLRPASALVLLSSLLAAQAADQAAPPAQGSPGARAERVLFMRPSATTDIQAEPARVWKRLVAPEGLADFGVRIDAKGKTLEKVGDHAQAAMAGDRGNLVVTYAAPAKEWRAAWEPEQGHYACVLRFTLAPKGKATRLTYEDGYSEEKADKADANLAETRKSMTEGLARFKAAVEKASASQ